MMGPLSHTIPIPLQPRIPEDMGSGYGNRMGPAYHKVVQLLGVPGITLDINITPLGVASKLAPGGNTRASAGTCNSRWEIFAYLTGGLG